MARIFFLTQVQPYPLDAGPKIRAYHMARHLAAQHQITLVSFVRPDDRAAYVEHLRSFYEAVYPIPIQRSIARNVRAGVFDNMIQALRIMQIRDLVGEVTSLERRAPGMATQE